MRLAQRGTAKPRRARDGMRGGSRVGRGGCAPPPPRPLHYAPGRLPCVPHTHRTAVEAGHEQIAVAGEGAGIGGGRRGIVLVRWGPRGRRRLC